MSHHHVPRRHTGIESLPCYVHQPGNRGRRERERSRHEAIFHKEVFRRRTLQILGQSPSPSEQPFFCLAPQLGPHTDRQTHISHSRSEGMHARVPRLTIFDCALDSFTACAIFTVCLTSFACNTSDKSLGVCRVQSLRGYEFVIRRLTIFFEAQSSFELQERAHCYSMHKIQDLQLTIHVIVLLRAPWSG